MGCNQERRNVPWQVSAPRAVVVRRINQPGPVCVIQDRTVVRHGSASVVCAVCSVPDRLKVVIQREVTVTAGAAACEPRAAEARRHERAGAGGRTQQVERAEKEVLPSESRRKGSVLGSWVKPMRDAVRNKERCQGRRTPTQDPSTHNGISQGAGPDPYSHCLPRVVRRVPQASGHSRTSGAGCAHRAMTTRRSGAPGPPALFKPRTRIQVQTNPNPYNAKNVGA